MNILRAISDPKVFAGSFKNTDTWAAWIAFLAALFALPMTQEQLLLYQQCTGRTDPPSHALTTAWLCVGRRGGKSFILALIAVFLACFKDWRPFLAPGEVGTIMIVAQDRKQSRVIMRFIKGLLHGSPMLAALIESEREESITLSNRIVIETHTCSYRSVRGYTVIAALLDEITYWRSEEDAANPAHEVLTAIKPALGTVPGSVLLCASSPQFRKGELWEAYRRHYGRDGDPSLYWLAPTRTMNPSYSQAIVDAALEEDPARNRAEYLAEFRSDQEGYVTRAAVEACVDWGVRERPPERGIRYNGFCDLSGGGADSMALTIFHRAANGEAIHDCMREVRSGANPSAVVEEFSTVLRSYGLNSVHGDRYAAEWPVAMFATYGIKYLPAGKVKNDIYISALPLINSGKVRLLDHPKMINQFCDLDRVVARGGRESVDHPKGGHDDLCNACAGGMLWATAKRGRTFINGYEVDSVGKLIGHPNPKLRSHERDVDRPAVRFVHVNEQGNVLTTEQAQAIARGERRKT